MSCSTQYENYINKNRQMLLGY